MIVLVRLIIYYLWTSCQSSEVSCNFRSISTFGSLPLPTRQLPLQEATCTTGGIFQGRAYGNGPNIGDFADEDDNLIPMMRKIYLYITANDPATWDMSTKKHSIVIKHSVTLSLTTIFKEIGDRHSPV